MRPYIFYLPVAILLLVGFVGMRGVDLMDPSLVRRPGGFWTPLRVLRDDEWTAEGLVARRRLFRAMALGAGASLLLWLAVLVAAGPR